MEQKKKSRRMEIISATMALKKIRDGDDPRKAEAAEKILGNNELFKQYVQVRINKRNGVFEYTRKKKTEKSAKSWKNFFKLPFRRNKAA